MRALAALVVATALAGAPALAQDARSTAFVAEFERACVPGRLTYAASLAAAEAAGWVRVEPSSHPELDALLAVSRAEADSLARDPDFSETSFAIESFSKPIGGLAHHLVISRSSAVIGDADEKPNPWVFLGCYLYDFGATEPIDPAAVTALIGNPISRSQESAGAIAHVWGPPCPMPRTGDTYLNFVPEGSPLASEVPFTGVALNFSTSELPAGEPAPDPYC